MAADERDIVAGLAEIIEEVTGIEQTEVTPDKKFVDDLDVDSLSMVEIAVQTEDKYGIEIPDERMKGMGTVRDVVDYIKRVTVGRS
ncbi:acyl carrier protein [Lawsonella clevelandensis]|uniref:Acyl carrier protein n=1 Tax=Lawsonella clevelandensis TaxID=1528099 RepID=A0A0M4MYC8_9ACTN|nr:acyl carrier protein [Lawsonella clevelandensis]DAX25984.1 MAG TPA: acyl carrier protein [Caudoviricetes sp.]ALE19381.1 acyl carrier protein [Lawsonella clevelandensis]ALE35058.1 acyl carrier protein [Lawsonella clevelandensis]MDU7194134.1 acyl carrier protein [Lawsonella clevelandensis]VHO01529.1 Meromycolate extension acyl carrier protein [Lawsonella clevelandensis]